MDKIIILGKGRSACHAPKEKIEGQEVWGVLDAFKFSHVDRVFEMHEPKFFEAIRPTYVQELKQLQVPLYMQEIYQAYPNAIAYPLKEIIKEFKAEFFLNSISYMIALAIMEKPKEIILWGVDMKDKIEYIVEKGCVEFWLGVATGRGIDICVPACCSQVMKRLIPASIKFAHNDMLYGYSEETAERLI